jgi:putative flippase GtrA
VTILKKGTITFATYVFFAGIATLVDLSLLFTLTEFLAIHYFFSGIVSYICGGLVHYVLNKKYTFKNRSKKIVTQLSVFFGVALVGLAITQLLLYVLVELWAVWYIFAKLISIFIVLLWNFTGHKYITFKVLK